MASAADDLDRVDKVLAAWARERPELEMWAMAFHARIKLCSILLNEVLADELAKFELSVADFELLATIRRAGEPYELSPTELRSALFVSGGTITNRVDALEGAGLVYRHLNEQDRRGWLIGLTADGWERIDRAMDAAVARMSTELDPIGENTVKESADILRAALAHLDGRSSWPA